MLNVSVKSLSQTPRSTRNNAGKSLNENWFSVFSALTEIIENKTENESTRSETKGILKFIKTLNTSFMSIIRFNACCKKLQSVQINLGRKNVPDIYRFCKFGVMTCITIT